MKRTLVFVPLLPLLMAGGCESWPPAGPSDQATNTPQLVLQITESRDPEAFDRITAELRARDAKATILVTGDFGSENCQALTELHAQGYQIMAFLRPESPTGERLTLSVLSREEQEQAIHAYRPPPVGA